VPTVRELIDSGRKIHGRLEDARHGMESLLARGLPADAQQLPAGQRVGSHELPEWYLACFRTLRATYGNDPAAMQEWNDFLRRARDARPDLDTTDALQVVRAGADDLAGALEVLERIESRATGHPSRPPTITVGREFP
jgi:hypothetical protein